MKKIVNKKVKKTGFPDMRPELIPPPPPKMAIVRQDNSPQDLIALAIEKNAPIDYLERLMKMKAEHDARVARQKYFEAFARFQSICPEMVKNRNVFFPHKDNQGKTEYKFQELANIAKNIRKPLSECGMAYKWSQVDVDNKITVTCIVTHIDGHEEVGEPIWGLADGSGGKNNIQAKQSTISYLRRTTLTGIFGISSSDDDDGAGGARQEYPVYQDESGKQVLSGTQLAGALRSINEGKTTLAELSESYDMTDSQYKTLEVAEKNRNIKM